MIKKKYRIMQISNKEILTKSSDRLRFIDDFDSSDEAEEYIVKMLKCADYEFTIIPVYQRS